MEKEFSFLNKYNVVDQKDQHMPAYERRTELLKYIFHPVQTIRFRADLVDSAGVQGASKSAIRIGKWRTRLPVACQIALPMAPTVPTMPISPTPLIPNAFT